VLLDNDLNISREQLSATFRWTFSKRDLNFLTIGGVISREREDLLTKPYVLVVQRFSVRLVIERSLFRLSAGALSSQLGQLSLLSLRGRYIEYQPAWLGLGGAPSLVLGGR